ncbi:conjugal transfer protein TraR [Bacteriovorax stolpii]|uniref:Conjugal transfer protein TraR n=1 Tax=Bacteriovorax stolpii TaxID=960 RepID=A0A2K9NTD1_BACTC|nr:TraR/DksA C4-type zinc finger protein [Bacteriovorax stolpii]AUN98752.1 conjugal transfer protein TraR [Bacteriovorax stolpii]QDK41268.1 conjugal transfer protein TraR [Bacteriovorax stolpii]TDP55731.1 TraR/DksA family transcriptional regulator [Bacteriovorax stolpii]BDT28895.1 TraR/DksA family transcriptional regulator [Bacteriovorax sp. HI3]
MNAEMMKQFENLFIELKKNTLNEMKMIDPVLEKGDEVDLSSEDRQRALELKLLGRQNFMLKKIDNALFKIKNGTFGICEECDGEIEMNRLRARPVATQCIACKEEEERNEGQMLYEKRSHTHGKTLGGNVIQMRSHAQDLETVLAGNSEF